MIGRSSDESGYCDCRPRVEKETLVVDATDCSGGPIERESDCRATVVEALSETEVDRVAVRADGIERSYEDESAALLQAAGRFAADVGYHDEQLADRAKRDPLAAAFDATARPPPVGPLVGETGLAAIAVETGEYDEALSPYVGPTIARERVKVRLQGSPVQSRELDTGATVELYRTGGLPTYAVLPIEASFGPDAMGVLADAYDRYATGNLDEEVRAHSRAVREAASDVDLEASIGDLVAVLEKHTTGYGVLEDLFADPELTDVYASAPVTAGPIRAVVDGETVRTNVRLTENGANAFASRIRATSGRSFSRASPTIDATASLGGQRVRIAGIADPVSDGVGFAFRSSGTEAFTLPALVENGTVPPRAAGLLSEAVRRSAATIVAGARSAGKTTTLGALLWELDAGTRVIAVEDTPELPVGELRSAGRDVQQLHTTLENGPGISPSEALRTALRLGESAIVLGEVRGEEAAVLYESMRVGASGSAVLGTIHGDGGEDVRERVVADLGVDPSAFEATDLVVTMEAHETPAGRSRRLAAIEEVVARDDGVYFEPLFEVDENGRATATGRIDRGNSHLVATLADPAESYDSVRRRIARQCDRIERLAERGITAGADVARAYERTGTTVDRPEPPIERG